jgi:hypothetical protein
MGWINNVKEDEKNIEITTKSIWDFSPEDFREKVRSLYRDPKEGKPVSRSFSLRVNPQGTLVITIRRDPKWISRAEISELSEESGIEERLIYVRLAERKIPVTDTMIEIKPAAKKAK